MADLGLWPADISVRTCRLILAANQIVSSGPGGGSEQVIDRMNDRWMASLTLPVKSHYDAHRVRSFLNSFRGQLNWVKMHHFAHKQPAGTMRGAPVLQAQAAQGADELRITTTANATLERGDLVGVGGYLFEAAADAEATSGGLLILPINNRVRVAQAAGAAVTWSKPTVMMRCVAHGGVEYVPGYANEVTMELMERVA